MRIGVNSAIVSSMGWCLVLLGLVVCFQPVSYAESPLSPDDIISLCNQGTAESKMVSIIHTRGIGFEMDLPVMQKLLNGNVSSGIIQVLMGLSNSSEKQPVSKQFLPEAVPGISLSTDPPGFSVVVDGIEMGVTPFYSNKLTRGKHLLTVEHPLFFSRQEEVDLSGKKGVALNWKMEAREPLILVNVQVSSKEKDYPWSWIIRPRDNCPGTTTVKLVPWQTISNNSEAIFIFSDESKRVYRGSGKACLEVLLWRGEIRKDLPIHDLPPSNARYFISDITFTGMESIDMDLLIQVDELDPLHPKVTLESDNGTLTSTRESVSKQSAESKKDRALENIDLILK